MTFDHLSPGSAFRELEMALFKHALDTHGGDIDRAARWLGISRTTMYKRGFSKADINGDRVRGVKQETLDKQDYIKRLISDGLTVRQIAERLTMTPSGVYNLLRLRVA